KFIRESCARAEAVSGERRVEVVSPQAFAEAREEIVAGIGERLRGREGWETRWMRAGEVSVLARVAFATEQARVPVNRAGAERSQKRERLDRRAGRERLFTGETLIDGRAHAPRLRIEHDD